MSWRIKTIKGKENRVGKTSTVAFHVHPKSELMSIMIEQTGKRTQTMYIDVNKEEVYQALSALQTGKE